MACRPISLIRPEEADAARSLSLSPSSMHLHSGERVQCGEVEHRDRDDGEAVHLARLILRLG